MKKFNDVETCKKPHRYDNKFSILNESQEYYMEGRRHQCAACAYEQGYNNAINGFERMFKPEILNISQAGVVRHKDPKQAYDLGYDYGLKKRK